MVAALRAHDTVKNGQPVVHDFAYRHGDATWSVSLRNALDCIDSQNEDIYYATREAILGLAKPDSVANYYYFSQPRRYAAYIANHFVAGYFSVLPISQASIIQPNEIPDLLVRATSHQMLEEAQNGLRLEELSMIAGSAMMYSQIEAQYYASQLTKA